MSRQVGVLLTALVTVSALLLGSGPVAAASPVAGDRAAALYAGEQLVAGERLSSPNGQFHLTVQPDGNTVLYVTASSRPLWATNTLGSPGASLVMQSDGNLVLYGPDDAALWASNTTGHPATHLTIDDDGRAALTWPGGEHVLSDAPSELLDGESLVPGQSLVSPGAQFRLTLQDDGNLVESNSQGEPVWASGTSGDTRLTMKSSGELALQVAVATGSESTSAAWSTHTAVPGSRLVLQNDGNFVLYAEDVPIWSRGADERRRAVAAATAAQSSVRLSPGNDYPNKEATPCGAGVYCVFGSQYSARGFAYRNCTDFVAWKIGMTWNQIADGRNGHAVGWKQGWIERGRSVGTIAKVGSVAWWSRGTHGHVAYVVGVNDDGSAVVEQYNAGGGGEFSVQTVRAEAYLY